jgi:hypothetical protein
VKPTPNGAGFGSKPGGNGPCRVCGPPDGPFGGAFGTIPNGTTISGYPALAARSAPFAAGVKIASRLECLGLTPVKVWTHRSAPDLVARLAEVARAIEVTVQGVNVEQVGDDDTHPFLSAHIPVISIHSVTQDTIRILHSERDRLDAINFDDYYTAYKLAAYYLAYLDLKAE